MFAKYLRKHFAIDIAITCGSYTSAHAFTPSYIQHCGSIVIISIASFHSLRTITKSFQENSEVDKKMLEVIDLFKNKNGQKVKKRTEVRL